ncbi:MAG: glycerophosphodiester phosphodiesterase family protein [Pseudomonadota bacterium]
MNKNLLAILIAAAALCGCAATHTDHAAAPVKERATAKWNTLTGDAPLIIAHRGASGYRPEHTLEAYALAIDMGADVIEPDLVITKDGVLVARHDRYLSTTTNVADKPEFADRKKPNADPKSEPRADWWVEDFTLAELKSLRARQPFPGRSKDFDDQFDIPTFDEVLALVAAESAKAGRPVGVYPETKHPRYFENIGLAFDASLLEALKEFNAGPVFIQSFEPAILKRLKGKTDAKLVQLVYEETPGAGPNIPLAEIAAYANGVGPNKYLLYSEDGRHTDFLARAHTAGLFVHPWTFRNDQKNEVIERRSDFDDQLVILGLTGELDNINGSSTYNFQTELWSYYALGVDAVFIDHPDIGTGIRDQYR